MKRTAPLGIALVMVLLINGNMAYAQSNTFADSAFAALWNRVDAGVKAAAPTIAGPTTSWLWGPEPLSAGLREQADESPSATRLVQYFDKARMEINNPSGERSNPWFVTNGLLPIELITGQEQVGQAQFVQRPPATLAAIGDADNTFPTYADFATIFARQGAGGTLGNAVTNFFNTDGSIGSYNDDRADSATQIAALEHGHGIPTGFVNYMTERSGTLGRLFVFGHPVSGSYWVRVKVENKVQPVLFQVFERRILTYTPNNPAAFRVESGNVGLHYLLWRYPAPTLTVNPPEGPAGTTFTIQVSGLPAGEQAAINVIPPLIGPTSSFTVTGGNAPVTITVPTTTDASQGIWAAVITRSAISPAIRSVVQFRVTAP